MYAWKKNSAFDGRAGRELKEIDKWVRISDKMRVRKRGI